MNIPMRDVRYGLRLPAAVAVTFTILLTLPAGILAGFARGGGDIPQDALAAILKKQEHIAFWGERIHRHVSDDPDKEDTVFRKRVLHIPPSEYRVDYLDLPDEREWHVLAQGENLYSWGSGDTVWVSERSEVQTLGLVITHTYLDLLRENYRIDAGIGQEVADRSTYAVVVTPLHPGRPSLKAWVDSTYGVPLKVEVYDSRENLVRKYEYSRIRFRERLRVETFPLPEGDIVQRRSRGTAYSSPEELLENTGRHAPVADRLPSGFTLTRIVYGFRRDREYVQSFYSDGYASFSLFVMENPRRAPSGKDKSGIRGVRSDWGRDYAYATGWIGVVQVTVMGDIAESELLGVLSSVRLPESGRE